MIIGRGFTAEIDDSTHNKLSKLTQSKLNTVSNKYLIILHYFPKTSRQIAEIFLKFDFKVVHTPFHKIQFTNLKYLIDSFHIGVHI